MQENKDKEPRKRSGRRAIGFTGSAGAPPKDPNSKDPQDDAAQNALAAQPEGPNDSIMATPYPPVTIAEATEELRAMVRGVTDARQIEFLFRLSRIGIRSRAAHLTGVTMATIWQWRRDDPAFEKAYIRAMEVASDLLEDEALRRAAEGVVEPVFQSGRLVGQVRRFSDQLLMFTLKGAKPEKYADRQKVEHTFDVADRLVKARERAFGRSLADAEEENN